MMETYKLALHINVGKLGALEKTQKSIDRQMKKINKEITKIRIALLKLKNEDKDNGTD